ncbi:MAG: ABC transporter substrate-binding protein [Betaproteobacteria bacterium]
MRAIALAMPSLINRSTMRRLLALLAFVAMPAFAGATPGKPITLQLYWKHQFQFAGYYAAIERGFYRDAGFDVAVREPQEGIDPIDMVLSGGADYGVGASELALRRGRGQPIVAIATILQHSPLVLITLGSGTSLQELVGKKVMMMPHETELIAYLQFEGLPLDRLEVVPHTYDVKDLLSHKVDAMSGYSTDEIYRLKQSGKSYSVFSPRSSGIDFYGDTLFTTNKRSAAHPDEVAAFRDASLRGWQYAMDHPGEVADLIIARYSQRKNRDELLFEAEEMRRLMQPQLIEIGHMNPGRWQHIAEIYAQRGMLPTGYSLDGLMFGSKYGTGRQVSNAVLVIGIGVLLAICAIIGALWRTNRRLSREVAERGKEQAELRHSVLSFRALIESVPLAIVTWDTRHRVTGWNRVAQKLFGWSENEMMDTDFSTLIVPDSANGQAEMVVKGATERGVETHSLNSVLTKDQRIIQVEWHNTVVPRDDGRPDTVLSLAQEVSPTKGAMWSRI